jgi:hypothetical protein
MISDARSGLDIFRSRTASSYAWCTARLHGLQSFGIDFRAGFGEFLPDLSLQ